LPFFLLISASSGFLFSGLPRGFHIYITATANIQTKDERYTYQTDELDLGNSTESSFKEPSASVERADQEKGLGKGMIAVSSQPIYFDANDEGNPRNWSVKKKSAMASYALLAAFVA